MTDEQIKQLARETMKGISYGMPMPRSWKEIVNFASAILSAGGSEGQAEPKLDKPAQVSHTSFGVGVSWATVIGAAQRHYEYRNDKSVPRSYPDRYNINEIDALRLFPVDQSKRQFVDYTQYLALQREYEAMSAEITAPPAPSVVEKKP